MPNSNVVIFLKCEVVTMMKKIYHPGFTFRLPRAMGRLAFREVNSGYEAFITNYKIVTSSDSKRKYEQRDTS